MQALDRCLYGQGAIDHPASFWNNFKEGGCRRPCHGVWRYECRCLTQHEARAGGVTLARQTAGWGTSIKIIK